MNEKKYNSSEEQSEYNVKHPLANHEYDLYHEDDDTCMPIIRVKRTTSVNREKWKIFENAKETFVIEGSKITNKEKEYLRTPEGFNFLIAKYKSGIKAVSKMRLELKKHLKQN